MAPLAQAAGALTRVMPQGRAPLASGRTDLKAGTMSLMGGKLKAGRAGASTLIHFT